MSLSITAALTEFVAQALFVFTCTGAACGQATPFSSTNPFDGSKGANSAVGIIDDGSFVPEDLPVPFVQSIAMTFGFTITALAYAMGSKSGAQINGAVTWGFAVAGELSPIQAVANIFMQCWGSVLGSGLLSLVYRKSSDRTNGLGSNRVGPGFSPRQAFLGEAIMVFILMYVVLETAVNKKNKANAALAPVAIGFAVYIGHTMLIPVDGCSLNPTRSFGPALVSYIQNRGPNYFRDFWVFVIGPVTGATVAAAYYKVINAMQDKEAENEPAAADRADTDVKPVEA